MKKPSAKEQRFAKLVAESGNATQAYREVFGQGKLSNKEVGTKASILRRMPHVKAQIDRLLKTAEKDVTLSMQDVLREWAMIATADPNEIASVKRRCCRHCYGRGHRYQWKDEDEFAYAVGQALQPVKKGVPRPQMPSDDGGYGFNFTLRPHPECTECRGEGHEVAFVADTTQLKGAARKLYAGTKPTANGTQILMRDQDAALANIARFHGMFTDNIRLAGAGGGPLLTATMELPADPVAAASAYVELVKSKARG